MGALVIPIVILVVALGLGALAISRFARRRRARADALRARARTLHYAVPPGMDVADMVLRLNRAGYEAVPDTTAAGESAVLIGGRGDRALDREEVRRLLAESADSAAALDVRVPGVRFTDE